MRFLVLLTFLLAGSIAHAQQKSILHVIGFFTAKNDLAHISFVHEANRWLDSAGKRNGFHYDSTSNWENLNDSFLRNYQVVLFLDTRPEAPEQRAAFQRYMENGGGWIGFHFSAFALTPSTYPQDWDWYHETFLGSGSYKSNTWRPTKAVLRKENSGHPVLKGIPSTFTAAPNEWYAWENDLRTRTDIRILLSVDSTSYPLGTGPKPHEVWHSGYYPIAWTNTHYKMVYMNMGHNDMDYEGGTNRQLSSTFSSKEQNRFLLNAILWTGGAHR
ncbi:MAG TPA: ThuA domain-containing protein [Flavisolibacter sp.]|jgi:hypothetical protein|nr:ThuA domain-containing protein [Flavisolibacter sp.]